jgi:hypothetical protein
MFHSTLGEGDMGATDKLPGWFGVDPAPNGLTRFGRVARLMLVRATRPLPFALTFSMRVVVCIVAFASGCAGTELREDHFSDGSIRARYRVRENEKGDAVADGAYTEWHQNGRVARQGRFLEGKYHGTQTSWYESGAKQSERTYDRGRLDGVSRTFFERGGKQEECEYRLSRKHGVERRWFPNGGLSWEARYDDGVVKSYVQYDAAGGIIDQLDTARGFGDRIR